MAAKVLLRYGAVGEEVKLLQRSLNEIEKLDIKPDGQFGKITEEALRGFQQRCRFPVNGFYTDIEAETIEPHIQRRFLRMSDIDISAPAYGLPVSTMKAFTEVESRGEGFLSSGDCVILFERHKFYDALGREKGSAFALETANRYPNICSPTRGGYIGGQKEHDRLNLAATISESAALLSASWGLFQIMGFNFRDAGFASVESYVEAMKESEKKQLEAVYNFIKNNQSLRTAIIQKNFNRVAELYNGKAYAEHKYHLRLAAADAKYM